jgi:penicillin-binding protein 1A
MRAGCWRGWGHVRAGFARLARLPGLARCMAWGAQRLRRAGYLAAFLVACYGVVWVAVIRNLPSADKLLTYQPPLPTMVRGSDGAIIYSYARERRVQLRFVDFPSRW